MLISIIVPAYNVENYLERCVSAIIKQTSQDYEVVIIDDGSTDSTGEIADKISKNNDKIRVIHQENKGLGGARNTGIVAARGDYLFFLDSDDYIRGNTVEIIKYYLEQKKLDILVFDFCSDETENNLVVDDINYREINNKEYLIFGGPSACNKVYRKEIFVNQSIYFPEKTLYEDIATIPNTACFARKIGIIDAQLYYYVFRQDSIISSPNLKRIPEVLRGFNRVLEFYKKHGLIKEYNEELEFLAILHVFYCSCQRIMIARGGKDDYKKIEKYMYDNFPDYEHNVYLKRHDVINKYDIDEYFYLLLFNKKYRIAKWKKYPLLEQKRFLRRMINKVKEI